MKMKETEMIKSNEKFILKQSKILKETSRKETLFFSKLTHKIDTALISMLGTLQQVIEEQNPASCIQERLLDVSSNAHQLLLMTNNIFDISRLEEGNLKPTYSFGDIRGYTYDLVSRFKTLANSKGIHLENINISSSWEINFDTDLWRKIIDNLLSNAIKHTYSGGSVKVLVSNFEKESQMYISLLVKDSGMGISSQEVDKIYNRSIQGDNLSISKEDNSIGLYLIKELVYLQGGEIYISSKIGKGTKFRILLPVKEAIIANRVSDFDKNEALPYSTTIAKKLQLKSKLNYSAKDDTDRSTILIIEQNAVMRNFIKSSLNSQKFNFIEAENEEVGLKTAFFHLPDIIIFDVSASKKEDYNLISELRQNKETAHIPIILLTAKHDDKTRIKGLKSGANVCLSKPLNADELALHVENFCRLKKCIHEDYINSLQKSKNGKRNAEDEFVSHIRKFIIDNIEMNNLNGDVVGKHLHMSRVHLHRKLKSSTGQSITEFVKEVRLNKAMEMIQEKKWNISEVSYKTGFSSISHFSRSFKQAYGRAPSEV